MTAVRRALLACVFFALALFPAHAQQPAEIRVGLGWQVLPQQVTITPGGAGTALSACAGCRPAPLSGPVTFHAAGSSLFGAGAKPLPQPVTVRGDYEIAIPGRRPWRVHFPATIRAIRGGLRIVLRIPLEEYVALVLASEGADFTSDSALQATAITVRSYAVSQRGRHAQEDFDVCDTTHCQLLSFDSAPTSRLRAAVESTEGELLWYRGEPAAAFYSANCAGTAEAASQLWPALAAPYLREHADPYCVIHGRTEWTAEITKDDLALSLRSLGWRGTGEHIAGVRITERTPSGRVSRIEIAGLPPITARAEDFRAAINGTLGGSRLRSNSFDVRMEGDRILFHGYGLGHGAGLCQAGAQEMGAEGKTFREILSFYFPGTSVGLTAQGLDWTELHGERIDLLTTQPSADRSVVPLADDLLRAAEHQTGWSLSARPELRLYPTVAVYRNATGEPGWVAASTKGHVIRLQPAAVLEAAVALKATLRHELLHMLVESRARAGLPLWFREGLVVFLENESAQTAGQPQPARRMDFQALDHKLDVPASAAAARAARQEAQRAVARLMAERGRGEVLSWVDRGVPAEITRPQ